MRRWSVWAVALAVLLAPGLHDHADGGGAHQDCYVCSHLARDSAPPPATLPLPPPRETLIVLSEAVDETLRSFLPTTHRARGPPVSIA